MASIITMQSGDGWAYLAGTDIPAATIVQWLRQGHSRAEVYAGNPSLPTGAVEAVERWAAERIGPGWRE